MIADQPVAVVKRAAGQELVLAVQDLHLDTVARHGLKVEVDPALWYRQLKCSDVPLHRRFQGSEPPFGPLGPGNVPVGRLAQMLMGFGRAACSDAHALVGQFDQSDPGGDRPLDPFSPILGLAYRTAQHPISHQIVGTGGQGKAAGVVY